MQTGERKIREFGSPKSTFSSILRRSWFVDENGVSSARRRGRFAADVLNYGTVQRNCRAGDFCRASVWLRPFCRDDCNSQSRKGISSFSSTI